MILRSAALNPPIGVDDRSPATNPVRKQLDAVTRSAGIDRRDFGGFVEAVKEDEGRRGHDNFTDQELEELAEIYKELEGGTH